MHHTTSPQTGDRLASSLRGFGPLGIVAVLVILAANLITVPLSAALVLAWVVWSRTPWRDIGFTPPKSWLLDAVVGVGVGIALKLVMKSVVMPLLGADAINQTYHYLVGNPVATTAILVTVIVAGGFCEETVFRGYMFERLRKLLGRSVGATIVIIALTTGLFAAGHYRDQGLAGVEQAILTGAVFGTIFAATRRLWIVMFAHAAYDIAAIAIIYWNLETQVAHLFFK